MTNLMQDFTDIDAVALGQLREAERGGEGIKLPFPVLNLWVLNGAANLKALKDTCPAQYFGGWATDNDELGKLILDGTVPSDLDKWSAFEGAGKNGNAWNGRASRVATAAFIASRARWINGETNAAGPHYDKAKGMTRQHKQYLALLYISSKPWGYVVLSAKGWQTKYVYDAIKAWAAAIQPHRAALNATNLPLSAFALTIGTEGPEPKFQEKGSGKSTSPITPMGAVIKPGLTAEMVAQRFIGAPNLRANNDKRAQAAEWLAAWGKAGKDATAPDDEPAEETEIAF